MENEVLKCAHCGQPLPTRVTDFSVGDRVYHETRKEEGVVAAIDAKGLHIKFGGRTEVTAIFDDDWFRVIMKRNNGRPLLRKVYP